MIQTTVLNDRGETETIDHHDRRYWDGPYRYEPYPKTLFRATAGEGYTHPEQRVVRNQHEHEQMGSDWTETPDAARTVADRRDAEFAELAARRITSDARMSEQAQREAVAVDRATDDMVAEIPVARKKPGRKPKALVTS